MNSIGFLFIMIVIIMMIKSSREDAHNEENTPRKSNKNRLVCPDCGSVHVDILDNTKKGFSLGKTVGGSVIAGPLGGLVGFTGKKNKRPTMRCLDCGWLFEFKL